MPAFLNSHGQALVMLAANLWQWHSNGDMPAYAQLDGINFDEVEQKLRHHIRLEKEANGLASSLLPIAKLKTLSDYEVAVCRKPNADMFQLPGQIRAQSGELSQPISAKKVT